MKVHTNGFKQQIKTMGKEIDSRITFGLTVLGNDELNAVTPSFQGNILKSVMKQLEIDSNVSIPIGTQLKYEFGLKVNNEFEYIDFGNYIVFDIEKQEDTNSYKILCYDKMLASMLEYKKMPIIFPITIRDYINLISNSLGLEFANENDVFANYDKVLQSDPYENLGYTFRDILDELAQVTGSTICLNDNDQLEIRYIKETNDVIDEEFLKDVNVNFGEQFGPVNTIVLSRSGGSDNIYYPENLSENPYEIKIIDNQIMNFNDRDQYLPDIYEKLNGLQFYINDFVSTGLVYYELCDRYTVKIGDNNYSCVMLNNEILVTQGLEENVYTELPEQTQTDYTKADKTDRRINQAYLLVDKQNQKINAIVETTETIQKEIVTNGSVNGSIIKIEDGANEPLISFEIDGKSVQDGTPTPDTPIEIESVGYENLFIEEYLKHTTETNINAHLKKGTYTLSLENNEVFGNVIYIQLYKNNNLVTTNNHILNSSSAVAFSTSSYWYYFPNIPNGNYLTFTLDDDYDLKIALVNTDGTKRAILVKGTKQHNYIPYGKFGVEVEIVGKNKLRGLSVSTDDTEYWYNTTLPYFTPLEDGWGKYEYDNTNGTSTVFINAKVKLRAMNLKPNKEYTIVTELRNSSISENSGAFFQILTANPTVAWQTARSLGYANVNKGGIFKATSKTKENFDGIECSIDTYLRLSAGTKGKVEARISIFEEDVDITNFEYEEYKSKTLLLELNEPLRSLPSGVKDVAYIKNNILYVDRKIKSVIFDGSETNWSLELINNTIPRYYIWIGDGLTLASRNEILSNRFLQSSEFNDYHVVGMGFEHSNTIYLYPNLDITNIDEFKSWLSTNNTEVIYELGEPYTENLGEIEMPSTYQGATYIYANDELEPTIEVEYVRDTNLSGYVQGQINNVVEIQQRKNTELEQTNESISARVSDVSTILGTINNTLSTINETILKQTADQFQMLFNQTQVKGLIDDLNSLVNSNNITLETLQAYINYGSTTYEGELTPYILLGASESPVKLMLIKNRIRFMNGESEMAFISNNALNINEMITKKINTGHWVIYEDSQYNLNTKWVNQ